MHIEALGVKCCRTDFVETINKQMGQLTLWENENRKLTFYIALDLAQSSLTYEDAIREKWGNCLLW